MAETPATPTRRRWRRGILWTLAILIGLVLVSLMTLRYAATTAFGRNFVEKRIEAAAPAGQSIDIEGLSGDLLGTFRFDTLTVSDEDGIWLTATDFTGNWRPLALRKRSLLVRELTAQRIDIARRPVLKTDDSTSEEDEEFPLRLAELDKLSIGALSLSDQVTPQPVTVSVNGSARASRRNGALRLQIIPEDEAGDRLAADLAWTAGRPLNGTLDLTAPAGGLFASLARLEDDQSLTAILKASGTPEDWSTNATAFIDNSPALRVTSDGTPDTITFSAQANPTLHPLAAQFADWLGSTVEATGTIDLAQEAPVIDTTITGAKARLIATAIQPSDDTLTADLRLEADDLHTLMNDAPLSLGTTVLDGRLARTGDVLSFEGTAEATSLETDSIALQKLSGPVRLSRDPSNISLTTDLQGEGARLSGALQPITGARPRLVADLRYAPASDALTIDAASLTGTAISLTASGGLTLADALAANLKGNVTIDGAWARLDRPVKANATWSARTERGGAIAFNLDGKARNLGELPAPLSQWMTDETRIQVSGVRAPSGALSIPTLRVDSGDLSLTGTAARSAAGDLSLNADSRTGPAELGALTTGALAARLRANGTPDRLIYALDVATPSLTAAEARLETVDLTLSGAYAADTLTGDLSLTANSEHGPLTANSALALAGEAWRAENTRIEWGGLTVTGTAGATGTDLTTLRADAAASGALPDFIPAGAIDFTGRIEGDAVQANGELTALTAGPLIDSDIRLDLNGTAARARYDLTIDGTSQISGLERPLTLTLGGTLTDILTPGRSTTSSLQSQIGRISVSSTRPITAAQSPRGLTLDADISGFGGDLNIQLADNPAERAAITMQDISLSDVLSFTGRAAVTGRVSGHMQLADDGPHLAGTLTGRISDLQQASGRLSPVEISVDGRLVEEILALDFLTTDGDALEARAELRVPVSTSGAPFSLQRRPDAPLQFDADIDGEISGVASVIAPPDMVIAGALDFDVSGSLPLSRGDLQGTMSLADGSFEHGDAGIILEQINFGSRISAGAITLDNLDSRGRDGGTLTGEGVLSLSNAGASTLTLTARELVVVKRREGRATASGKLTLDYDEDILSLGGDLKIDDAVINLDHLPSSGKPTLDVTFRTPGAEDPSDTPEAERTSKLDIRITSKRGINLRGQGVDAEAGLDARLTGSFGDPKINGEATIIRGRFNLLGKRFVFRDSTVNVSGDAMAARLDISAVREADDFTAIVRVTGTPRRPKIDLEAEPEFPEDEVLSRILFGRSPSELSTLEAARLAGALAQLSGGGGFDLLGGLEDSLGLDTLDLGQSSAGGVQLTTGKYISDDVYLELTTGATGAPGLALEWEPLSNIEVGAETIPGEGQSVAIKWKRDFE